jgi:AbrB family looped-hinge helix DNA binding protein
LKVLLLNEPKYDNHTCMTTSLGARGQVVIPKAVRDSRNLREGDDFEVLVDDSEPDVIRLRCIRKAANAGLVEHLLSCPHKGELEKTVRRREKMRAVRL